METLGKYSFLQNLSCGFDKDVTYTFFSDILVAMHPSKSMDSARPTACLEWALTSEAFQTEIIQYILAMADTAYSSMRDGETDQSIILSGVSGSGKSDFAKRIVHLLRWFGQDGGDASTIPALRIYSASAAERAARRLLQRADPPNPSAFRRCRMLRHSCAYYIIQLPCLLPPPPSQHQHREMAGCSSAARSVRVCKSLCAFVAEACICRIPDERFDKMRQMNPTL